MPILKAECDLFPEDLLEKADAREKSDTDWWAMYTYARHEKKLMRKLLHHGIPFYGPTIERRFRSPNGRLRTSYEPLFKNYVFICADERQRLLALQSNCVTSDIGITDVDQLVCDLKQIRELVASGAPLSQEARLVPGDLVRVKTGIFAGLEGTVIRREHDEVRLLVGIRFMGQGVSVLLDDCQFECIG